MPHASGTFEVKLASDQVSTLGQQAELMRMTIDKQFEGELQGTSTGEMLAVMTAVEGSAGYVALERVTGSLHGRQGSFVLQHSSTMVRGEQQQSITVVPDSGTGELRGLSGQLVIRIEAGQHFYDFDYVLAAQP
jgi:predicted flavoprotein YhiN